MKLKAAPPGFGRLFELDVGETKFAYFLAATHRSDLVCSCGKRDYRAAGCIRYGDLKAPEGAFTVAYPFTGTCRHCPALSSSLPIKIAFWVGSCRSTSPVGPNVYTMK